MQAAVLKKIWLSNQNERARFIDNCMYLFTYTREYQSKFKLTTNGYINYNQVGLKLHCGFNIKRHDIKRAPRYTS